MKFASVQPRAKKYLWQGLTPEGFKASGIITAYSKNLAKSILYQQNITTITSMYIYNFVLSYKLNKLSSRILAIFMRQLATLILSGVPIIQSCDLLLRANHSLTLNYILSIIKLDLLAGKSLVDSLLKFPEYFNTYTCSLIQAGIASGTFACMLNRIAFCKERNEALKKKIKQALLYPCLILMVATIVSTILLILVIPRFVELFDNMHSDLPMFTRWVIQLSDILRFYGGWICLSALIFFIFIKKIKISTSCQIKIAAWRFKVFIYGELLHKNKMMHFTRNLATTLSAGLPILEALTLVAPTVDDKVYSPLILKLIPDLKKGCTLNEALSRQAFPHLVIQMTKIGEESGNLSDMLDKVADMYENDFEYFFNNLSQFLEPLIMTLLGVLIGGLVIAMYLPIFKLGTIM